jgi:hypothetical protein
MTKTWHRAGLDASGVNYFTIGKVVNGNSTWFDFASDYYQSWLGGYMVKLANPAKWTLKDHYNLALADQEQ